MSNVNGVRGAEYQNGVSESVVRETITPTTPQTEETVNAEAKINDFNNIGDTIKEKLKQVAEKLFGPKLSKEATVTKVNEQVIIESTAKNDKIGIVQDPKTGDITVTVNGEKQTFSGKEKDNLVIRAGGGDDVITVDRNVTVKLVLEGGDGNDTITGGSGNDEINGGKGRDFINGTGGNDKLIGGDGNDVIYGGDGNDEIQGNAGDDYLEGSKGNDNILGGAGKDVVSGGIGDDTLDGGTDNDVLYAGQGKDNIKGGAGNNRIFAEKGDTTEKSDAKNKTFNTVVTVDLSKVVGTKIVVEGSDEFKEIVEADLEMFRSSQVGRGMLTALDKTGQTITIRQTSGGDSATFVDRDVPGKPQPWYDEKTGKKGSSVEGMVNYNPQMINFGTTQFQPSVKLFHELGHNYDYTHGTLRTGTYSGNDTEDSGSVNVRERVATGLPIDHDNDPKTAEIIDPLHPKEYTENGLREEMGLPKREHYSI